MDELDWLDYGEGKTARRGGDRQRDDARRLMLLGVGVLGVVLGVLLTLLVLT